ncbi:MAG TPA: M14 family zinc carboxypeptidase [Cyclobacteriaceae bacterium]|nr:M14 family zinc carboxypeptidase [Cyclobacteriaceae bacterium]
MQRIMNKWVLALLFFNISNTLWSQVDLSFYLPDDINYNTAIPTPKSVIGHEVGEWHISHDRLVNYMYAVAAASNRINIAETGRTFEARPLLLLTITSPKNHQRLEEIRQQHVQLTDPNRSGNLNIKDMPVVVYIGFSIHGNEASGSNAALAAAYHLAAAQGPEIEKMLEEVVILFDPSFNPDGLHRFSSWVNSRKSIQVSSDSYDTEHNEPWPGGRTNHYWFDLNRDWLVAQLPESQARAKSFHNWKPNVLTDHHEMGTNSTFFFQPGVPSRNHPLTPVKNFELTKKIGEYHAKYLDEIGSLYYTQEGFDDFYYGKGSTFPDVQGAIGILFEQASSRGHAQDSQFGTLTFPFTVRNQFTTVLSTLEAAQNLREELLMYQKDFFKNNISEAGKDPVKGYVFGANLDKFRAYHLAEIFARHDIEVYKLGSSQSINGKRYESDASYVIPLNQKQYRLIKSSFEKRTQFEDSLFYDISSWTLPLAFALDYDELRAVPNNMLGEKFDAAKKPSGKIIGGQSNYAYVFETYGYYAPRAIYRLLSKGIRLSVADAEFYHPDGRKFPRGSILIALGVQEKDPELIEYLIKQIVLEDGIDIYAFNTGLDYKGVSLGSPSFSTLREPKIALLVGDGVSSNDAGEIWHLLDTRFHIPVSLVPTDVFNRANYNKYNTIIMSTGSYNNLSDAAKERLRNWVQNGGVIIGLKSALNWLNSNNLGSFAMKRDERKDEAAKTKPYADISNTFGAQQLGGAIFEIEADLTHPLFYGYTSNRIPVFKSGSLFMERSKNQFGNPAAYTGNPLLSGYISKPNLERLRNASMAGSSAVGQGRVIGFTENLTFRAFWYGSNKMLMNAIFFGHTISSSASR